MAIGDIYFFQSDRARGHAQRNKYHIEVCEGDWRDDGDCVFLFINKSNAYDDGFEIRKANGYAFLQLDISFIACSSPISYEDDYLQNHAGNPVGRIRNEDIQLLIDHIQASRVMEEHYIKRIVEALAALLP